jgi:hypothetical protein
MKVCTLTPAQHVVQRKRYEPPVLRMSSDDPRDLEPFERALR